MNIVIDCATFHPELDHILNQLIARKIAPFDAHLEINRFVMGQKTETLEELAGLKHEEHACLAFVYAFEASMLGSSKHFVTRESVAAATSQSCEGSSEAISASNLFPETKQVC